MYPFKFDVSLLITHPKMEPDEICNTLGLEAKRKWKVGMPRSTPCGALLEGAYKETHCSFYLKHDEKIELTEFLKSFNKRIDKHKEFLI